MNTFVSASKLSRLLSVFAGIVVAVFWVLSAASPAHATTVAIPTSSIARLNADGSLDKTFAANIGAGFDGAVYAIKVLQDGSIIVGGDFTTYKGVAANGLAKLSPTGVLDTTFSTNIGTGFNSSVYALGITSASDIIVGGIFDEFNGFGKGGIVKLSSSGVEDATFASNVGTGFDDFVLTIAVDAADKIYIGGSFTTLDGVNVPDYLVAMDATGTLDAAFNANLGTGFSCSSCGGGIRVDGVWAIVPATLAGIFVGGQFSDLNSAPTAFVAHLSNGGVLDPSFATSNTPGPNSAVTSLSLTDGGFFMGGDFTTLDSVARTALALMNFDGTATTSYNSQIPGINYAVETVVTTPDGGVLFGGEFDPLAGTVSTNLSKLTATGVVDTTFLNNLNGSFNGSVNAIAQDSESGYLIVGDFTQFDESVLPDTGAGSRSVAPLSFAVVAIVAAGFVMVFVASRKRCHTS